MDLLRLLNRDGNGNKAQPQTQDANTTQQRLAEVLRSYDQEGGSNTIDLWNLHRRFASVVQFDNPLFLPRFSDFALSARELDQHRGRTTFQLGGFIPPPGLPVDQTPPVLLHPDAFRDFQARDQRPAPQPLFRAAPQQDHHLPHPSTLTPNQHGRDQPSGRRYRSSGVQCHKHVAARSTPPS